MQGPRSTQPASPHRTAPSILERPRFRCLPDFALRLLGQECHCLPPLPSPAGGTACCKPSSHSVFLAGRTQPYSTALSPPPQTGCRLNHLSTPGTRVRFPRERDPAPSAPGTIKAPGARKGKRRASAARTLLRHRGSSVGTPSAPSRLLSLPDAHRVSRAGLAVLIFHQVHARGGFRQHVHEQLLLQLQVVVLL